MRRWENIIEVDLTETRDDGADWIHLAQDKAEWRALVNAVMNFWIP